MLKLKKKKKKRTLGQSQSEVKQRQKKPYTTLNNQLKIAQKHNIKFLSSPGQQRKAINKILKIHHRNES